MFVAAKRRNRSGSRREKSPPYFSRTKSAATDVAVRKFFLSSLDREGKEKRWRGEGGGTNCSFLATNGGRQKVAVIVSENPS